MLIFKFVLLYCLFSTAGHDNNVVMNIAVSRAISSPDSVFIKLEIANNSKKTINLYSWRKNSIAMSMNYYLEFNIIRNDTVVLNYEFCGPKAKLPYEDDYVSLKPGANYLEEINLTKYYSEGKCAQPWETGDYKIHCRYKYLPIPKNPVNIILWKGEIESNTIEMRID